MKKELPLHIVDLFLIATALENRVEVIVTTDKKFKEVKEIGVLVL
jgi:predicted nucleic acid-binding protein